eukprot:TRINITY_DN80047_c0_g1_i1.p1 TRINITY_DN80047_c0_g1~~TRINITY_DN80047_c0_g1_i1.p1  ORF type:complete len:814 (+),score=163.95 TRINITY_DN80047_c0_g1_i1:119-2560(+)
MGAAESSLRDDDGRAASLSAGQPREDHVSWNCFGGGGASETFLDETQTGEQEDDEPVQEASKPKRYEEVPLMWGAGKLLIDDDDATLIVLFADPEADANDTSLDELIEEPYEQAKNIFERRINLRSGESLETGLESLKQGPVTRRQYRRVIWEKFLWVLESSGFRMRVQSSVDEDEIMLKIKLDRQGEVIKQLATRFQYHMPFKAKSYRAQKGLGSFYKGGDAPKNYAGGAAVAHAEYTPSMSEAFEPFSEVDEIRLMMLQIKDWVAVQQLLWQGIIKDIFPAVNFDTAVELNTNWSSVSRSFTLPDHSNDDAVRDYFGERVAFFFVWTTFYVRWLSILAVFGLVGALAKLPGVPTYVQRYCRYAFFLVISMWAALFNQRFKHRMKRSGQQWGVETRRSSLQTRPDWNPDLESSWRLTFVNLCVRLGIVAYLACFIRAVSMVAEYRKTSQETGQPDHSAIVMAILIQAGGWVYARTAAIWVTMQNHDNQAKWDNALSANLAIIKLFISLWPFIDLAFVQAYSSPTCARSLQEAAELVYKGNYPENTLGPSDLSFLDTAAFRYESYLGDSVCVYGCYPEKCDVMFGRLVCTTNCVGMLEESLLSTFIVVVGVTIGNVLLPIFLVRWEAYKEMKSVEHKEDAEYSLLQVQAKCSQIAQYEYYSSGGSYMEDFAEYVILFSILVCFGMMLPGICFIGFLTTMVQYRLYAYRMVNITCRPFPDAAEDIGVWQRILEVICQASRLAFIFLEHFFLILQVVVGVIVPSQPEDVDLIEQINESFKASMMPKKEATAKKGVGRGLFGAFAASGIDLSLTDN